MELTRTAILELLAELGRELEAQGQRAELIVVGGAAIALAFDARRATRDIDAVFVPKSAVYHAGGRSADQRGLPTGYGRRRRCCVRPRPAWAP